MVSWGLTRLVFATTCVPVDLEQTILSSLNKKPGSWEPGSPNDNGWARVWGPGHMGTAS